MSTPAQHDPLIGKVLADRFEILSRIGEGGTGVVYKAKQITVDRTVAIKVSDEKIDGFPKSIEVEYGVEPFGAKYTGHVQTKEVVAIFPVHTNNVSSYVVNPK